ncbi:hypothetical protein MML48_2g00015386 [Holotrichia oblita]|uniref:Uncharacterized protein n=1 Tax=Holotrichia oblita TaxID=644536 RepID=A0ACB9TM70_HOLOL|nr:hypothetical protein MML48_2g00015386 [Holotrichia oblita]
MTKMVDRVTQCNCNGFNALEESSRCFKRSYSTVNKISSMTKQGIIPPSPKKKREKKKPVVNVDDCALCAIRNTIYNMYRDKEHITLCTLNKVLKRSDTFNGCTTSLWKVLQNIGFHFKKDDPKQALVELPHIALKRISFLQQYVRIKQERTYQFVFLDETWIFQDGSTSKTWQDENVKSVKAKQMPGKRWNSQSQELVLNVLEYFERKKENGGSTLPVNAVYERVCDALHISRQTVYAIKQRKMRNPILSSPGKKRPRAKPKTKDLREPSKMEVRNTVYMYKEISSTPRPVVFLDETWIYEKGNKGKSWQNDSVKSVRKPEGYDGKRFIILHAGTENGFISGASLMFASNNKLADYHASMNSTKLEQWETTQLFPNIPEKSLILMDNAPYHSVVLNKAPTIASRKQTIMDWLHENNANFSTDLTKYQFLD